jgi:predicted transcriptional regulator
MQIDLENANSHLEEVTIAKNELQKQLNRLQDDFKANKDRLDKDTEARVEEMEDSK